MFFFSIEYLWNMNSSCEIDPINRHYWPLPYFRTQFSLKTRKWLRLRRSRSAFRRIGTLSYENLFIFRSDFFLFKGFKLKNLWWICMHWQMCKRVVIIYLFEVLTAMKILSAISQNKKNKKGKKRTWSVGGENRREKVERYYVNYLVSQRDEWKSGQLDCEVHWNRETPSELWSW